MHLSQLVKVPTGISGFLFVKMRIRRCFVLRKNFCCFFFSFRNDLANRKFAASCITPAASNSLGSEIRMKAQVHNTYYPPTHVIACSLKCLQRFAC